MDSRTQAGRHAGSHPHGKFPSRSLCLVVRRQSSPNQENPAVFLQTPRYSSQGRSREGGRSVTWDLPEDKSVKEGSSTEIKRRSSTDQPWQISRLPPFGTKLKGRYPIQKRISLFGIAQISSPPSPQFRQLGPLFLDEIPSNTFPGQWVSG